MPPKIITSLQNQRIKSAIKLRSRRQRDKQGRILIDGARELLRALRAGIELSEAFVCEPFVNSSESRETVARLQQSDAQLWHVTPAVYEKLAFGERAEGVLGVAAAPRVQLDDIKLSGVPLVAVLEGVEKPGNIGAVLRSADAAGVSAVIVADAGTDLYNPNCIRASLGTVFTLPVCAASAAGTLDWLRRQRMTIYATRVEADLCYDRVDYVAPTAIVLGSEVSGVSTVWNGPDVMAITLPMRGVADSLNVSAVAAVLFYEALRQRDASKKRSS